MDRAVLATANELLDARHYPGVLALVDNALDAEPDSVPLLLCRAKARFGLRRDLDAQADLRDIIRLDPQCSSAYRLLGELAARRDEYESAAIFFREALRLSPKDKDAAEWLAMVAPTPRLARGTRSPEPMLELSDDDIEELEAENDAAETLLARGSNRVLGAEAKPFSAKVRPVPRGVTPELPGFGDYLVTSGILTRERLRAAQAYQRSMKVQLSTAIVTLGLATPQRIEWAAVAHQSELARQR